MFKKLILLALTTGALSAFAAPAAQAVQLTDESGSPVPMGEFVTAVSENTGMQVGPNTLFCDLWGITGEVQENGPRVMIGNISVTTEPTPCNFNGVPIMHIATVINGSITLEEGTKGTATGFTTTMLITNTFYNCHFSNEALPLAYSNNEISVGGAGNNLKGLLPCTSMELRGDFGIFDHAHTEVWSIDH